MVPRARGRSEQPLPPEAARETPVPRAPLAPRQWGRKQVEEGLRSLVLPALPVLQPEEQTVQAVRRWEPLRPAAPPMLAVR